MTMPSPNEKPIAITTWNHLEKLIAKESSPYLDKAKFVINTDAYARITDDDIESDVPFLSYVYSEMTSDESLDFSVLFFKDFVMLIIGPTSIAVSYEGFGFNSTEVLAMDEAQLSKASTRTIAVNILLTIKLLLNGQIAAGCSWKNGSLCAFEIFLLGFEHKPFPLFITPYFSLLRRAGDAYTVKQNKVLTDHYKIDDSYPLLPSVVDGSRLRPGRDVPSIANLEPLTKAQYDAIDTAVTIHEASDQQTVPGKEWQTIYRTVDFWIIALSYIALSFILPTIPALRPFFDQEYASIILVAIAWGIIPTATGLSLGFRQASIASGKQPLRYRLEKKIHTFGWRRTICLGAGLVLTAVTLALPFWTLASEQTGIHSTLELGLQLPILFLIPLLSLGISALMITNVKANMAQIIAIGLALAIGALFIIFNGVYMNTSDQAPMPSDIAITLTLFALAAVISCGVRTIVLARHKTPTAQEG
jgi:hypothetical protein